MEKWPILNQNHGVTSLEKTPFSVFLNFLFFSQERRFFVLQYDKTHFAGLYWHKKKVGKMAIFGPGPWTNPFGKMSIFLPYKTCFLYSLENCFFVLEYHKAQFPGLYCLKKYLENMANFGPKPRTNPFGKILIF